MPSNYAADRIALQDLMSSYAAAVDERDLELYRSCFAEDVEVVGFGTQAFHGRDDWLRYVWSALEKYSSSQHLLGPQLATIDGDTASTRTDVQALHILREGNAEPVILWATYKTDMQRVEGGGWQITRHELVVRGSKTG